jgi:predicted HAD superfamily phosphohydrolase
MEMTDVMASLTKIGMSVKKLADAAKDCDNEMTKKEFDILRKMVGRFSDPKTFAFEMGTNIVVNGVDIYREMSAAYTNYLAKDFESFGRDIGVSLALIFIGASEAAKANPGAAKVMESMAQMQTYPSITDTYNSGDNKKWVQYLSEIAAEDE